jgi:hypothetical protein
MMRIIRLTIAILMLLTISCSKKSTEQTQPNPVLSFDPANVEIGIDNSAEIIFRIDNLAQPIFAASFQIRFNNSIISMSDSLISNLDGIFGENAIQFMRIDSSIIRLSLTKTQGDGVISGSGIICGFNIAGAVAGTCSLAVLQNEAYFYDTNGEIIAIDSLEYSPAIIVVN